MGEIADAMLEGQMCQWCGEVLGDGDGFPVVCPGCQRQHGVDQHGNKPGEEPEPINVPKDPKTIPCPVSGCKRVFRDAHAVGQHVRDKHAG